MVETSAWIETMRPMGDAHTREKVTELLRRGQAAWCDMIKLELWNGALAKEMPDLEGLALDVVALETTPRVWEMAAALARKARIKGMRFPPADLLIFACAKTHGAEIVHRDKHFDQLKALWRLSEK
jgi:predicted nucleic acid-binding protein